MKNYGDLGGCYPSRPQASTDNTLRDLHNSSYDTKAVDVKFNSDSARLGLFSSSNILQIADAVLRVVFLLFLPCF